MSSNLPTAGPRPGTTRHSPRSATGHRHAVQSKSTRRVRLGRGVFLLPILGAFALGLAGCPGTDAPDEGGGIDGGDDGGDPPAGAVFVKDPDPDRLVAMSGANEDGTTYARDVPADQMLLMFDADVSATDAASTVARMEAELTDYGLDLVGQIPDVGIYQFEIRNEERDADAALGRLDAACEALRAYEGVANVAYNELLVARAVENDDDNSGYAQHHRCPFAVLDYYQAIPIFDELAAEVTFSDVTVAVIDSGLWVESDQFDDILPRTRFLATPEDVTPYDWHLRKHGTNIAALIAADNNDGLLNGLALRVVGEHLHLVIGEAYIWGDMYSLARTLACTREATQAGADIVVLSLGRSAGTDRPGWLLSVQEQFSRIFDAAPDTLFIAAAGNENFVLNGNDAPAGMPNANLLTVGGHASCNPDERYWTSCTGPGLELAGPATVIPSFVGDNLVGTIPYVLEGNSFATPLVASIAAIVHSIDPRLHGAELKDFLLDADHTWPAAPEVGGRRVALLRTAGSALLSRAGASLSVDKIIDAYGPPDDLVDPSGYSINRMCGRVDGSITGSYSETISLNAPEITWGPDTHNYGIIGMGRQVIVKFSNGAGAIMLSTTAGFRLNEPYTGGVQIIVPSSRGELLGGVDGGSGNFVLTECELTTRSLPLDWYSPGNPGPDQLVFIEVSGAFSGTAQGALRLSDGEHIEGVSYAASGSFTTAFTLIDVEADTMDYLERHCVGGYLLGAEDDD